eukprot:CAMPEP_0174721742 /NCGR_PEP_ID=MMETSP1094-20130205/37064_1 /TAXON_ID=156173 /ORGANISM="Chrysochromulina brevifilum, Strain UTEX LB 985" /LENGTH=75 /DNA_ID=CAMNT_0015922489 /DNA_START=257 /DNA_END=481 /DNA_ORIENTATION=+
MSMQGYAEICMTMQGDTGHGHAGSVTRCIADASASAMSTRSSPGAPARSTHRSINQSRGAGATCERQTYAHPHLA